MGTRALTITQKQTLKQLKDRGPISACDVHGNRLLVLQALRKRNLVKYKDGKYTYHEPPTQEEMDKYIAENHGRLAMKQISFDMCISMMTLVRIRKRLNLPELPRGGRKKGDDPRDFCDTVPAVPRVRSEYSNPNHEDQIGKIINAP
jgi:hypothetical protein